jgi:hypothetical protein
MMMKQPTQKQKLVTKAVELIKGEPTGIHFADLIRRLQNEAEFSRVPRGAITGAVWDLDSYMSFHFKHNAVHFSKS